LWLEPDGDPADPQPNSGLMQVQNVEAAAGCCDAMRPKESTAKAE
jgi:hypothetical protein